MKQCNDPAHDSPSPVRILPFCLAGSSGKSNAPVSYKGSIMYGSKKMRDVEADENGNPVTHGR